MAILSARALTRWIGPASLAARCRRKGASGWAALMELLMTHAPGWIPARSRSSCRPWASS